MSDAMPTDRDDPSQDARATVPLPGDPLDALLRAADTVPTERSLLEPSSAGPTPMGPAGRAAASDPSGTDSDVGALGPRTRWAAIVWGLTLAAVAAAGIWVAAGDGRGADVLAWLRQLSPATAFGYAILLVGALLLVTGLVGLLRLAQRAVTRRRVRPTP